MIIHPYLSAELAREHRRDLLARSRQQQLRPPVRATRPPTVGSMQTRFRWITATIGLAAALGMGLAAADVVTGPALGSQAPRASTTHFRTLLSYTHWYSPPANGSWA